MVHSEKLFIMILKRTYFTTKMFEQENFRRFFLTALKSFFGLDSRYKGLLTNF